ncbi:hypothetical protein AVEN_55170-1 [Araneus ventricosus]|uniref:Uncharacterized protein n=1 Tax=Araneus ventricosus TaxID=182803 RepID=A0A4Y2LMP5_ARAVE|nr:hypothetical protein AVEN_103292-1 [Araneus ventricosus]GBN15719.1 hypothetical protein AVEN_247736-1 [Araneus ventricosus]GBN15743.1 hypothetical protein AVEN_55170-1 [Araneus ventricosus]
MLTSISRSSLSLIRTKFPQSFNQNGQKHSIHNPLKFLKSDPYSKTILFRIEAATSATGHFLESICRLFSSTLPPSSPDSPAAQVICHRRNCEILAFLAGQLLFCRSIGVRHLRDFFTFQLPAPFLGMEACRNSGSYLGHSSLEMSPANELLLTICNKRIESIPFAELRLDQDSNQPLRRSSDAAPTTSTVPSKLWKSGGWDVEFSIYYYFIFHSFGINEFSLPDFMPRISKPYPDRTEAGNRTIWLARFAESR